MYDSTVRLVAAASVAVTLFALCSCHRPLAKGERTESSATAGWGWAEDLHGTWKLDHGATLVVDATPQAHGGAQQALEGSFDGAAIEAGVTHVYWGDVYFAALARTPAGLTFVTGVYADEALAGTTHAVDAGTLAFWRGERTMDEAIALPAVEGAASVADLLGEWLMATQRQAVPTSADFLALKLGKDADGAYFGELDGRPLEQVVTDVSSGTAFVAFVTRYEDGDAAHTTLHRVGDTLRGASFFPDSGFLAPWNGKRFTE